jgi:hypothetical protein
MPIVETFQVAGCRCWFYSDDHRPAHFHAGSPGEWEVRVYFLLEPPQVEVVLELKKLPGRIRRALLGLAKEYRAELLEEWSQKVHQAGEE